LKLNASADRETAHWAYISFGSNIDPAENLPVAVDLLREQTAILTLSTCYETRAVGSSSPNFYNMAACLVTPLTPAMLKEHVLGPIETRLGRVRSADKNAPRTIDLDIVVFDQHILDDNLWLHVHLALPFSELLPDLIHPESGETLLQIARRLCQQTPIVSRPQLTLK
jgi:2-amino-4-hydroxy-6-hydroxymethyldihydropteridine diphosphokinase